MGTLSGEATFIFIFVCHLNLGQLLRKRICSSGAVPFLSWWAQVLEELHCSGKQIRGHRHSPFVGMVENMKVNTSTSIIPFANFVLLSDFGEVN